MPATLLMGSINILVVYLTNGGAFLKKNRRNAAAAAGHK